MIGKLGKNKILVGIALMLFLIAVPITLNQVRQTQEQRSGAAGEAIAILLNPLTKNVTVGEVFLVPVSINTAQNNVTAVDITFSFDANLLAACTQDTNCPALFTPSPTFSQILLTTTPAGTIHYVGVNPTSNVLTGPSVSIGTLAFQAKAAGTATVGFTNIHVNASEVATALPVNYDLTLAGTYTISSTGELSPTPTPFVHDDKVLYDFNDDGKVDEVDLNIMYTSFRSREGD